MKRIIESGKESKKVFEALSGESWVAEEFQEVLKSGKKALDGCMMEMGRILSEAIMDWDRQQIAGKDYDPENGYEKWGRQKGSIYLGKQKVKVAHPRLRKNGTETLLPSYQQMKNPKEFSEELLNQAMRGISARKYRETITDVGEHFGVSPTSVSNRLIEATGRKLKDLQERSLKDFEIFAVFLDTVHRGGEAFVVALGVDIHGTKWVLGFWQGATENKDVARALFWDLENRGLKIDKSILFVTDGGLGIIRMLKDRFGKDLIHQRCTIHKDRNIQHHLPKRYRKEAHQRFRNALALNDYADAKAGIKDFEVWLRELNESAADSLLEAEEELLTLHRLKVPHLLRKLLHSTNPIESLFSQVRHCEKNIKRYRGSKMSQRWLAAVALHAEETFRTVKGFQDIKTVMEQIKMMQSQKEKEAVLQAA
jgi:putative transposase